MLPANFLFVLLFLILGYVWVVRLIQRGLDELNRPATPPPVPPRRRAIPPPLPGDVELPLPPSPPPEPFHPVRWFAREVIGGIEGLTVMRALILKEVRTMLASRKSFWLLFSLSVIASCFFIIFWQNNSLSITIATRSQVSRAIFSSIYLVQFVGLALISTVMASATVTTERENKTLDLLLATRLSREQVILAKWFSNILYQLVLFASLLPIQALTFQLGGVGLDDYLAAAILVCGGIACHGMIGLAVSCHVRRTVTALLGSVGVASLVGLLIPAHTFFSRAATPLGSTPAAVAYLIPLGLVFLVAWRFAHGGLARRDTSMPVIARPVIDDQYILRQRRETWPFYLIDPLARPQHIADGQNPVYIKEQRISILGRLDVIIRLCYVAMFLSFVLVVAKGLSGSFEGFRAIARWEVSFIMLFVPVLAATGISKEYEENTLGLLRATPLTPGQIVWAKYRITMRFLAIVCCSLMIIPAVFHFGMSASHTGFRTASLGDALAANFKIIPSLIAWSAFYAALSLFCSSFCRRNVTAIVTSYASMLLLIASPDILGFIAGLIETGSMQRPGFIARAILDLIHTARYYVCPLLSPYYYYADDARGPQGHFFNHWESWPQIFACLVLTALAVTALVEVTKKIMILRARRG